MPRTGTESSKGTKIFSLAGNVANGGLVEVPMGITLRHVIFDIGGGMPAGHHFKAVQTGRAVGRLSARGSARRADRLREPGTAAGSMMGSGGMVVVDDSTCMVDFARFFLEFTQRRAAASACRAGWAPGRC